MKITYDISVATTPEQMWKAFTTPTGEDIRCNRERRMAQGGTFKIGPPVSPTAPGQPQS